MVMLTRVFLYAWWVTSAWVASGSADWSGSSTCLVVTTAAGAVTATVSAAVCAVCAAVCAAVSSSAFPNVLVGGMLD